MKNNKCHLCESKNTRFIFNYTGKDLYLEKLKVCDFQLKWYECLNCGVYYSKQYDGIEKVYEDEYFYDGIYGSEEILERYKKIINLPEHLSDNVQRVIRCRAYHERVSLLFDNIKDKYTVLDLGAGMGVFFAKFINNKFNGTAIELNKIAVEHMKNVLSEVTVLNEKFEQYSFCNSFDLITLNRVLEHIDKPEDMLREVYRALKNYGMLYIELPDTISYQLRGSTDDAFASGHYMVFNSQSVFYLLQHAGFMIMAIDRVKEPSGKYTIYAIGVKNE